MTSCGIKWKIFKIEAKTSNLRFMTKLELKIQIQQYSYEEFMDIEIVRKAREAALNAYAPYSKFNVGAAVLLENDIIVTGNNQENAAYPSGLCAERVAMFSANAQYPDIPVKAIAICAYTGSDYTQKPVPPCGACRQVLLETENRFNKPLRVIMIGKDSIYETESVKSLLPLAFGDEMLK